MQTEPVPALHAAMQSYNIRIKSSCIDLIQAIVSRGELDSTSVDNIEASIISQLYIAVHSVQLDLQNKLLHALHAVVVSTHPQGDTREKPYLPNTSPHDKSEARRNIHPLLGPTTLDALSLSSNRPILQHWIDFILMTVTELHAPSQFTFSLCESICRQLRLRLSDVLRLSPGRSPKGKATALSSTTDSEFIMLLNALERLILSSLAKGDKQWPEDETSGVDAERNTSESAPGLLGFVFGSEPAPEVSNDQITVRSYLKWCGNRSLCFLRPNRLSIGLSMKPFGRCTQCGLLRRI